MYRYISISLVGAIGLSSLGPTRVPIAFGFHVRIMFHTWANASYLSATTITPIRDQTY